jgi:hypothetical protein
MMTREELNEARKLQIPILQILIQNEEAIAIQRVLLGSQGELLYPTEC